MGDFSLQTNEDWHLRTPSDVRTTSIQAAPKSAPNTTHRKTELHVLRLSNESQQLTLDTLRSIHGPEFKLDGIAKYKDRGIGGKGIKHGYWEDRGTLVVQSVQGVSINNSNTADDDRLRRYALLKLENYGFHPVHCLEAYEHCSHDTGASLLLLFKRYMRVSSDEKLELEPPDEATLFEMRVEEKEALQSIYDTAFEEREHNSVWNLKFKIEHLLAHSPSEVRKAREAALAAAANARQAALDKKKKQPQRCRNFDRDGTCKFGSKCRFVHVPPQPEVGSKPEAKRGENLDENENELWFHVEVRFPPGSRYPYEAPYIYLKTTCHDIPYELRLRFARHLYREARQICRDGIPCVYSVCEMLQTDEDLVGSLDTTPFPSPKHSLFYEEPENATDADANVADDRPSHYERGQTSRNDSGVQQRNAMELLRSNRRLLQLFNERRHDERYYKMIEARRKLPAFGEMERILALIDTNQVVVISGETGCGKSTQVPQFILDDWFFRCSKLPSKASLPHVEILCTQPRRLSAIGVAERVAAERLDRIGQLVGYQIRLESKVSTSTRLSFCTTGILLQRLASDPLLSNVTHVIVDEVHERSQDSDFLLLILKTILRQRADLKVILMSATLNASLFSDYFGGAPVLDIPGRTFPVQELFLEDILDACDFVMEYDTKYCRKLKKKEQEALEYVLEVADVQSSEEPPGQKIKDENLTLGETYSRYKNYSQTTCRSIHIMDPMTINPDLIESVLKYIVEGDHDWPREGSILIFLPGFQAIQTVHNALLDSAMFAPRNGKFVLVPLHSNLSNEDQTLVFKPAPAGKRKIVLSTNIAETSVTIDDCVFVIDYGLMKEKGFDSNRNMESLDLVWVSRANAKQRKGRAGRVMPGVCIHLYTSYRYQFHILAQPVPEIQRVPLEQIVLRIKTLETFATRSTVSVLLETLEAPKEENVIGAMIRLRDVGALDADDQLTPLGEHLAALPVDVRIGKLMLYGAIFQCLDSMLTIAACLSNKSPFVSPLNKRVEADNRKRQFALDNSDHLTMLNAYRKWLAVEKRGHQASRQFASENYLSFNTLETIADLKYQYLELLVSIGFVPVNVPRRRPNSTDNILHLTGHEQNVNGENNRLLTSLLCAALYPNIVKIMTPNRTYVQTAGGAVPREPGHQDLRFKTRGDGYVRIHPSSINAQIAVFHTPFLVYQEKVSTSSIYIRDCSMLPLIALVLFAGADFRVELHDGDFLFLLENGWIILKADSLETAELVQCMRVELIKLLQEKIRDPCLDLLHHKDGCKIISNIVHLISNNF